jgi:hypothetical protein
MPSAFDDRTVSGRLAELIAIVPLLFAVVLGSSLIEFHDIIGMKRLIGIHTPASPSRGFGQAWRPWWRYPGRGFYSWPAAPQILSWVIYGASL